MIVINEIVFDRKAKLRVESNHPIKLGEVYVLRLKRNFYFKVEMLHCNVPTFGATLSELGEERHSILKERNFNVLSVLGLELQLNKDKS